MGSAGRVEAPRVDGVMKNETLVGVGSAAAALGLFSLLLEGGKTMSLTRWTRALCAWTMLIAVTAHGSEQPPTLVIGAAMPPFSLPGIDGKTYTDKSFASADILVIVFTCVHCPTAQAYQERIKKLVTDYAPKNVKLVAINPNHADAVRLDELAYSDLSDSFEEMQERAKQEHFNFVWLDDGPKQEVSHAYGPVA